MSAVRVAEDIWPPPLPASPPSGGEENDVFTEGNVSARE